MKKAKKVKQYKQKGYYRGKKLEEKKPTNKKKTIDEIQHKQTHTHIHINSHCIRQKKNKKLNDSNETSPCEAARRFETSRSRRRPLRDGGGNSLGKCD